LREERAPPLKTLGGKKVSNEIREMKLQLWQEIIGECIKFEAKQNQVAITLRVYGQKIRIAYDRNSKEGIILRRLGRKLVGRRLGILRTDDPLKPIVLRIMSKEASKQ
jgi:hypothetical protein